MYRRIALSVCTAAALALTGCSTPAQQARPPVDLVEIDVEDCDREDALKGERECSAEQIRRARAQSKPKASKPRSVSKPRPAAPSRPRTSTRR